MYIERYVEIKNLDEAGDDEIVCAHYPSPMKNTCGKKTGQNMIKAEKEATEGKCRLLVWRRVEDTRNYINGLPNNELLGLLIDVVEDYLESKGITPDDIPNDERDGDNSAVIYGSDYDVIADRFADVLGIKR